MNFAKYAGPTKRKKICVKKYCREKDNKGGYHKENRDLQKSDKLEEIIIMHLTGKKGALKIKHGSHNSRVEDEAYSQGRLNS